MTDITIGANGVIWLSSNTPGTSGPIRTTYGHLLHQQRPRVCRSRVSTSMRAPVAASTSTRSTSPDRALITWDNVPQWNTPASTASVQAVLYANGDIQVNIQSCNITQSGNYGFYRGNGTALEPSYDLSMILPTVITGTTATVPMKATADAPVIGSTPNANAFDLDPATLGTVCHVGVDQTNMSLDFIGMAGCTAYTLTLAVILPMTPGMATTPASRSASCRTTRR